MPNECHLIQIIPPMTIKSLSQPHQTCYVLCDDTLYYMDKENAKFSKEPNIIPLTSKSGELDKLKDLFPHTNNIAIKASEETLKTIESLTGHSHVFQTILNGARDLAQSNNLEKTDKTLEDLSADFKKMDDLDTKITRFCTEGTDITKILNQSDEQGFTLLHYLAQQMEEIHRANPNLYTSSNLSPDELKKHKELNNLLESIKNTMVFLIQKGADPLQLGGKDNRSIVQYEIPGFANELIESLKDLPDLPENKRSPVDDENNEGKLVSDVKHDQMISNALQKKGPEDDSKKTFVDLVFRMLGTVIPPQLRGIIRGPTVRAEKSKLPQTPAEEKVAEGRWQKLAKELETRRDSELQRLASQPPKISATAITTTPTSKSPISSINHPSSATTASKLKTGLEYTTDEIYTTERTFRGNMASFAEVMDGMLEGNNNTNPLSAEEKKELGQFIKPYQNMATNPLQSNPETTSIETKSTELKNMFNETNYTEYTKPIKLAAQDMKSFNAFLGKIQAKYPEFYNKILEDFNKKNNTQYASFKDVTIMPVQRLPRCELLLKELQKRTSNDLILAFSHQEIQNAQDIATDHAKELNSLMNEPVIPSLKKLINIAFQELAELRSTIETNRNISSSGKKIFRKEIEKAIKSIIELENNRNNETMETEKQKLLSVVANCQNQISKKSKKGTNDNDIKIVQTGLGAIHNKIETTYKGYKDDLNKTNDRWQTIVTGVTRSSGILDKKAIDRLERNIDKFIAEDWACNTSETNKEQQRIEKQKIMVEVLNSNNCGKELFDYLADQYANSTDPTVKASLELLMINIVGHGVTPFSASDIKGLPLMKCEVGMIERILKNVQATRASHESTNEEKKRLLPICEVLYNIVTTKNALTKQQTQNVVPPRPKSLPPQLPKRGQTDHSDEQAKFMAKFNHNHSTKTHSHNVNENKDPNKKLPQPFKEVFNAIKKSITPSKQSDGVNKTNLSNSEKKKEHTGRKFGV